MEDAGKAKLTGIPISTAAVYKGRPRGLNLNNKTQLISTSINQIKAAISRLFIGASKYIGSTKSISKNANILRTYSTINPLNNLLISIDIAFKIQYYKCSQNYRYNQIARSAINGYY